MLVTVYSQQYKLDEVRWDRETERQTETEIETETETETETEIQNQTARTGMNGIVICCLQEGWDPLPGF